MMSSADYRYLYGQLESHKIPADIYEKIMTGEGLTPKEEMRMKEIIDAANKEK